MTSRDFVQYRLAALRYFFKASFGYHWHATVSKQLGHRNRLESLQYHRKWLGSLKTLDKLEALAISHGFKHGGRLGLLASVPDPTPTLSSELEARPRRF